ncbi:hypothetical protein GKQ77_17675 [Streptomyces sp. BG9H]|uniref:Uncharacterized protein n=1 Tax=Streptomyces anatolicus TaxID=2675858 RepID=A0ABS6YPQ7_9ACTN|nr:hypothetical protein [Streptomyces anatolicus]MBW5423374.1 hypothetical protein [Streptomyces anatolicus]
MITMFPVGSWSWETKTQALGDRLADRCVRGVLDTWLVLQEAGLTQGAARADVSINSKGDGALMFSRTRVPVPAPSAVAGAELSGVLPPAEGTENAEVVTIDLSTPGICLRDAEPRIAEKLFMISVDAWASGAGTITLYTFSDAWMSHSLRGHRQLGVQETNAPRLRAALSGITRLTGADIVPGDSTSYGTPTEYGFEDLPDEDPDLLDSWYMFEVPRRTDRILARLPQNTALYKAETDSPVEFVKVAVGDDVIGYLWASDGDNAAGYEPHSPAGDVSIDAGIAWLVHLGEAKRSGLSPSRALRELESKGTGDSQFGAIVTDSRQVADSLEDLQELSGRE